MGQQRWLESFRQRRAFQDRLERQMRDGYDDSDEESLLVYDADSGPVAADAPAADRDGIAAKR